MKNKIYFIKFTSLLLVIALISSFTACKRGNEETESVNSHISSLEENTDISSSENGSNTNTSDDSSDINSSENSSDTNTSNENTDIDSSENSSDSNASDDSTNVNSSNNNSDTDISDDNNNTDESESSNDTNTSNDNTDINSSNNNSDTDVLDDNNDSDELDDLFEDLDLTVYQSVEFDNVAEQKDYAGMTGILPCFWFLPDSTLEKPYSEKQLDVSIKKFLQMGVTIVRCHAFEPAMAWDAENDQWDWDTEWMKGFYKYCDLMKENNIEIILNPTELTYKTTTTLGLEEPFNIIGKREVPEIFANFNANSPSKEQLVYMAGLYGQFYVDFYNEVIVKRGYDNINYIEPGTEPNNGSEGFTDKEIRNDYEDWLLSFAAVHNAMEKAGCRNKVKLVGPSVVIPYRDDPTTVKTAFMWLKWCVKEIDYMIDIYAAHQYGRPSVFTEDWTDNYNDLYIEPCKNIIKSTGKPLWCDEFNIGDAKYSEPEVIHADPLSATQLAYGYMRHMIGGVQASPIWNLVDIKWPNRTQTSTDGWHEGIHKTGVDVSVLESVIPKNGYYVYCMLGSTIQKGDTVYEGKSELGNIYSVMLKHKDGTYSFICVNFGWEENEVTYNLPVDLKNKVYEKTVYDPLTFKPNSLYRPIKPSAEIKNVKNSFTDRIGAYQVCVYNLK